MWGPKFKNQSRKKKKKKKEKARIHIVWFHLNEMAGIGKSTEAQHKSEVA
jgi:hypothetical protein